MSQPNTHVPSYFEIFWVFLRLGCISFGGPAAHLVFFYQDLVEKRQWINTAQYSNFMALSQFLPGPTSSQVGIAIGYHLNGYRGAALAWLGFTLPSALLMTCIAVLGLRFSHILNADFFHVVQLIVMAVVSWAFWQMLRSFCHGLWQYGLMLFVAVFVFLVPFANNQIIALAIAAGISFVYVRYLRPSAESNITLNAHHDHKKSSHAYLWLILFALPFVFMPILFKFEQNLWLLSFFKLYSSAAFVFGGGHVILPLLHKDFVASGLISNPSFDLGYAMAQLMPGPLFSFASYIGSILPLSSSVALNSLFATLAIFIPSFLLIFGVMPYWHRLTQNKLLMQALTGINAAVVGLLLSLILEMGTRYILSVMDVVFLALVIIALKTKLPIWMSLIACFMLYYSFLQFF